MRLGLGAAQFGMDYGVSNAAGRTPADEVGRILDLARDRGVTVLDTAEHYGDSEKVLGGRGAGRDFNIVTKVSSMRSMSPGEKAGRFTESFEGSLGRLRTDFVYGLLLHDSGDLLGPGGEGVYERASRLKAGGRLGKFGVSVYGPDEIKEVLEKYDIDLVQAPANVFDRRLEKSGILRRLKQSGVETHVRSVFLQGLLLMRPGELGGPLIGLAPALSAFRAACEMAGVSPALGAFAYVRRLDGVDRVIVGVNNREQLEANLRDFDAAGGLDMDFSRLDVARKELIDPRTWAAQGAIR